MSSLKLQPKNWQKFQHYKDRNPPWIKLHKDLLDDYDWWSLPVDSRALAPCLWLLASCYDDGIFDADTKILAFRFRMKESDVEKAIKPLIDKGYFNVASGLLADSKHDAMPETEERQRRGIYIPPIPSNLLNDYLEVRKAKKVGKLTETAFNQIEKEAKKAGITVTQAIEVCCARGWAGFKASWYMQDQPKQEEPKWKKDML